VKWGNGVVLQGYEDFMDTSVHRLDSLNYKCERIGEGRSAVSLRS